METIILYKYGLIYREVLHPPKIDWCQLMEQKTSNLIVAKMLEVFTELFPHLIHPCPYKVMLKSSFSLGIIYGSLNSSWLPQTLRLA